jgi:hypothetical protein
MVKSVLCDLAKVFRMRRRAEQQQRYSQGLSGVAHRATPARKVRLGHGYASGRLTISIPVATIAITVFVMVSIVMMIPITIVIGAVWHDITAAQTHCQQSQNQ